MRKWYRKFRRAESGAERQKNRIEYITRRKRYRTLLKDKKQTNKTEKVKNLLDKANDSKQFWKEVRSVNRVAQQQPNISELEWTNYFKRALSTEPTSAQPVVTDEADPPSVDVLDSAITEEEIMRAVEHLKTNKAPGTDGILAEMIRSHFRRFYLFWWHCSIVFLIQGSTRLHGQVQLLFQYIKGATRITLIMIVATFSQLLCPVCKNEIEDESHVIFRCNAYESFRKEVNIIASTSTTQDTFNALSCVMAADDEESVIQLSCFLCGIELCQVNE